MNGLDKIYPSKILSFFFEILSFFNTDPHACCVDGGDHADGDDRVESDDHFDYSTTPLVDDYFTGLRGRFSVFAVQKHRYLRRSQKREVFTTPLSPVDDYADGDTRLDDAWQYGYV